MPSLSKRPCAASGCAELVASGRCSKHARELDRARGTTTERGYDSDWEVLRKSKLATDPVCEIRLLCQGEVATEVDHIIPIEQRPDLRLEWSNLQSCCKRCNVAKARQNGEKGTEFRARIAGLSLVDRQVYV